MRVPNAPPVKVVIYVEFRNSGPLPGVGLCESIFLLLEYIGLLRRICYRVLEYSIGRVSNYVSKSISGTKQQQPLGAVCVIQPNNSS